MGDFLDSILNPPETNWSEHERVPVYRHKDYLDALERDYLQKGLPFDRSKFEIAGLCDAPTVTPPPARTFPDPKHVPVTLTVMKNSKIKVTAHTAWTTLWERYFDKGRAPPLRALVQGYKAVGCDDDFLKNIIKSHDRKVQISKSIAKHINKVFNKKPQKKAPKREKPVLEKKEEDEDEPNEVSDEEEDDAAEDDEGFDMEGGGEDDEPAIEDDDVVLSDVDDL